MSLIYQHRIHAAVAEATLVRPKDFEGAESGGQPCEPNRTAAGAKAP